MLTSIVTSVDWKPLDFVGKAQQEALLQNTKVAALRKLAPDTGAYINEVCPTTPRPPVRADNVPRPTPTNQTSRRLSGETIIRVY